MIVSDTNYDLQCIIDMGKNDVGDQYAYTWLF